jgi:hypothetical protein
MMLKKKNWPKQLSRAHPVFLVQIVPRPHPLPPVLTLGGAGRPGLLKASKARTRLPCRRPCDDDGADGTTRRQMLILMVMAAEPTSTSRGIPPAVGSAIRWMRFVESDFTWISFFSFYLPPATLNQLLFILLGS